MNRCLKHNQNKVVISNKLRCRACKCEASKRYYGSHRIEHAARTNSWRKRNLSVTSQHDKKYGLKRYGLTPQSKMEMIEKQNGKCAICGTDTVGGRWGVWIVDHHHGTGKVRGLLCNVCNTVLGLVKEDIARLQAMIEYLKNRSPQYAHAA